jgi:endonuclease VIII
MPEGDTIYRTAVTLHRWLNGREITGARTAPGVRADAAPLIGTTVTKVEAVGKHLLIRVVAPDGTELVVRTHNKMTGSWHVYPAGAAWQRPERQARLVIEAGDRVAVLFNAPDIEISSTAHAEHHGIGHLGPDILAVPLDLDAIFVRINRAPRQRALGEVLLDQQLVCGIGNIYRCEALFLEGHHPWTSLGAITEPALRALLLTAHTLMRGNLGVGLADIARNFGGGPNRPWVYGRTGRPCRRCGSFIESRRQGEQARTAYWCPTCQPAPPTTTGSNRESPVQPENSPF